MLNKLTLTTQLVTQLPSDTKYTVEMAMQYWWTNIRANGGLRLTDAGKIAFERLEFAHYEFELSDTVILSAKLLLTLDKKLTCPYYITPGKKPSLIVYGGKEATMLTMYGDIQRFVNSLAQH